MRAHLDPQFQMMPPSRNSDGEGGATVAPEMTRKFFESILRASEDNPSLAVSRVLVRQMEDLKRHFCSGEDTRTRKRIALD